VNKQIKTKSLARAVDRRVTWVFTRRKSLKSNDARFSAGHSIDRRHVVITNVSRRGCAQRPRFINFETGQELLFAGLQSAGLSTLRLQSFHHTEATGSWLTETLGVVVFCLCALSARFINFETGQGTLCCS
jgi:hypothetical protein